MIATKTEYPGYCNYPEFLDGLDTQGIEWNLVDSLFKRDAQLNQLAADQVAETIQEKGVDLIHCHAAGPSRIAMQACHAIGKQVPIVQTMHGWGGNKSTAQEREDIATLNRIDQVVTVSQSALELLVSKGADRENIKIVYYGIQPQSLADSIDTQAIETIRERHPNRKIIACTGSLCPRKNQALLLQAIGELTKRGFDCHCVFIGEGESLEELQREASRLNADSRVSFLGYRRNADSYNALFDLFALPSLAEGMPLSIMEAFRDRTLVLGSDIPEISEMIGENERNGYLFESNNLKSLADAIERIFAQSPESRATKVENAHRSYRERFEMDAMIRSYESLYRSLISKRDTI